MRIVMLATVVALLGACYSEGPSGRYYRRGDNDADDVSAPANQAFDAYTTNGDFVRVAQDARNGQLYIVEPGSMRGERVTLISQNGGNGGAALVTTDVGNNRYYSRGSAGDRPGQ